MTYKEALSYMEAIGGYGIVPGLDSIRALCGRIGNPQDTQRFIHVAGTNGKGSVTAYLSTILRCAGYRVGSYVSPTLFSYRERIQVNGRPITQKALCQGVELLRNACDEMQKEGMPHPTSFEVETALGFWYFQKMECDLVVLETGMGGSMDATNVIPPPLAAVLTPISMDHMKFLGSTLGEIAAQKAGIIKTGCYVISARQKEEVMEVIARIAREKHCPLQTADVDTASQIRYGIERQRFDYGGYRRLEISLAGKCQIENAVLAVETTKALEKHGICVKEKALRQGLLQTLWPGRFTVVAKKPWFIVDGAHNKAGAEQLAQSLALYFPQKRIIFIMGVLRDKDYTGMLAVTCQYADQIITVTPPENARALPAYDLAVEASLVHPNVTAADSLEEAVEMSYLLAEREDVILSFGSLSYLGRMIKIVEKRSQKGSKNDRS